MRAFLTCSMGIFAMIDMQMLMTWLDSTDYAKEWDAILATSPTPPLARVPVHSCAGVAWVINRFLMMTFVPLLSIFLSAIFRLLAGEAPTLWWPFFIGFWQEVLWDVWALTFARMFGVFALEWVWSLEAESSSTGVEAGVFATITCLVVLQSAALPCWQLQVGKVGPTGEPQLSSIGP